MYNYIIYIAYTRLHTYLCAGWCVYSQTHACIHTSLSCMPRSLPVSSWLLQTAAIVLWDSIRKYSQWISKIFFLTHLDAGRSSKHPHPQPTNHWTLRPIVEYSGDSLAAGRMSQDFRWYLQVVTPNLFVPKITAETKAQGNASANQAARFQSAPLRRQARLKISKII